MTTIAVIDSGICNLRSVTKALEAGGCEADRRSHTPSDEVSAAAHKPGSSFPGSEPCATAWGPCAPPGWTTGRSGTGSRRTGPFLGVCLGMQALFEHSEEGDVKGLGIFPGRVVRFRRPPEFKIPHMGWNTIRFPGSGTALWPRA